MNAANIAHTVTMDRMMMSESSSISTSSPVPIEHHVHQVVCWAVQSYPVGFPSSFHVCSAQKNVASMKIAVKIQNPAVPAKAAAIGATKIITAKLIFSGDESRTTAFCRFI